MCRLRVRKYLLASTIQHHLEVINARENDLKEDYSRLKVLQSRLRRVNSEIATRESPEVLLQEAIGGK